MENYLDMDIAQLPEETKKRVDKERRKGEKKMEQFMKSIEDLSPDEKISALCEKNAEFLEHIRAYKGSVLVLQRKTKVIQKEKELLENEHSKSVLARSRLENLCRELQRQNKSIKDESLQKIREEEEKRKEVSARFQTSLNEVSQMMQQNTDKNLKLREDNIEISNKFQKLCDQFRQREEEVTRLTKQISLEKQLAEATLKRIECQLNAEREIWNKEKEQHAEQLKYGAEERAKLDVNLKNLEEHLAMYSKKYEEFESTIVKSNQVFDSYKTEMSRMTKQINRLEKDCNVWKDRWQLTQTNLNKVMNDNQVLAKDLADREKKLNKLAALCRIIQEERTVYLKQLKGNGITPNKTTVKLPISSINLDDDTKKEELEQLKSEMSALKLQLTDTQAICEKSAVSNSDNPHNDSNLELSNNKIEIEDNVSVETTPVADRNIPHIESDEQSNVPESDERTNMPESDTSDVSPVTTTTLVEQTECVTASLLINNDPDQVKDVGESSRENNSISSTNVREQPCTAKLTPKVKSNRPKKNK